MPQTHRSQSRHRPQQRPPQSTPQHQDTRRRTTDMGNAAMQERLRNAQQPAPPAQGPSDEPAVEQAPTTPYVDMGLNDKADHLVQLMNDSKGLLDQNGVSTHMKKKLAAIMINEGSRNLRRKSLSDSFVEHARRLQRKLKGNDLATLLADPAALKRFTSRLTEEEAQLFEQVKSGDLDLADLDSKDEATRSSARDRITESGIDLRANQYDEMQRLQAKKADRNQKLTGKESARLRKLERFGSSQLGMSGAKMGQLSGMSKDRFAEIYKEGQQRFEPIQYRKLKKSYIYNKGRQKDPTKDVPFHSSIGSFTANPDMQAQLTQNKDLIADMATSYGTAQIMGGYAQQGELSAKNADGEEQAVTLEDLQASADRLTPTTDDVHQQLAFMNMKNVRLNSRNMSNSTLTKLYNGSSPRRNRQLYYHYTAGLRRGTRAYNSAQQRANANNHRSGR